MKNKNERKIKTYRVCIYTQFSFANGDEDVLKFFRLLKDIDVSRSFLSMNRIFCRLFVHAFETHESWNRIAFLSGCSYAAPSFWKISAFDQQSEKPKGLEDQPVIYCAADAAVKEFDEAFVYLADDATQDVIERLVFRVKQAQSRKAVYRICDSYAFRPDLLEKFVKESTFTQVLKRSGCEMVENA